jgi:hypothetical protein
MGGMLLSLLFLSNWYLPKPEAARTPADIDRSTIRLHSNQRWPEAVRIDTSAAAPSRPVLAANDLPERSPATAAALEAFAAEPPPQPTASQKPVRHAKHAGRSMMRNAGRRVAIYQPRDSRGWLPASW